jgi:ligand-binding sensor domain-containing protein
VSPSGKEPPLIAGGEAQEGMTWVGHAGPWRSIHCHMVPASGSILVCDDPTGRARRAVFCLAQDAHGALWLGTEEGPIRFDGLGWGPPAGLAPLSHSLAWTIDCTEPGSLWVGTKDAGLWRLEERTAAFVPRATLTGPDGLADSDIISLGRDDAGALWVGTHDGLAVVEGDRVRACFTARDGIPQAGICALAQDPGGYMLAGSLGGLLVFDSGGPCARLSAGDGLPDPCVYTLRADGHGGIWAGTRQGIAVLRAGRVREVIQEGLPAEVRTLCRDRAGRMWAGTAKGLALIERGAVQRVWTRADGLPSSAVWALLCDRAGRIWVGTEAGLAVGLGPYLSRLLAEAMRGSLELERTGPAGSTFRLALPVADAGGCES